MPSKKRLSSTWECGFSCGAQGFGSGDVSEEEKRVSSAMCIAPVHQEQDLALSEKCLSSKSSKFPSSIPLTSWKSSIVTPDGRFILGLGNSNVNIIPTPLRVCSSRITYKVHEITLADAHPEGVAGPTSEPASL